MLLAGLATYVHGMKFYYSYLLVCYPVDLVQLSREVVSPSYQPVRCLPPLADPDQPEEKNNTSSLNWLAPQLQLQVLLLCHMHWQLYTCTCTCVQLFPTYHSISVPGKADGRGDGGKETLRTESLEEAVSGQSLAEWSGWGSQQYLNANFIVFPHHLSLKTSSMVN